MSLNTERNLKTSGKVFRIGSHLSCDFVLDNSDARRVHCEIQSDSFGRITITNHGKRNPVLVNEVPLKGMRPLCTGSVVTIFEKKLRWINKNKVPRVTYQSRYNEILAKPMQHLAHAAE